MRRDLRPRGRGGGEGQEGRRDWKTQRRGDSESQDLQIQVAHAPLNLPRDVSSMMRAQIGNSTRLYWPSSSTTAFGQHTFPLIVVNGERSAPILSLI